jgi:hypothetical protein
MKKRQLKRKLAIATEALKLYKGYMIDGRKYADEALIDMWIVDNEYVQNNNNRLRGTIVEVVVDTLKEFELIK